MNSVLSLIFTCLVFATITNAAVTVSREHLVSLAVNETLPLSKTLAAGNFAIPLELDYTSRTTRPATFDDQDNINRFNAYTDASITYDNGNNNNGVNPFLVQATQARAFVTAQTYADRTLGSGAYNDGTPPGWAQMTPHGTVHRGHLVPNRLGGSGLDVRNIVALYRTINLSAMKVWETMVNAAFDGGLLPAPFCIEYRAIAYYTPGRDSPNAVRLTTWRLHPQQARTMWFDVQFQNDAHITRANTIIHWDVTNTMFPSLAHRTRP